MKNSLLLLILSLLTAAVFTSCQDLESPAEKMGDVRFTLSAFDFQNTGRPGARMEATSTWKHIYADNAVLNITNKSNGQQYTLQYNPNDFSEAFSITLPFGNYDFESTVEGDVFESFLPYTLEGEFTLNSQGMDITLSATTDYGLVTVKNQFVTDASISASGVDAESLTLLEDESYHYVYVEGGTLANLQITESDQGTLIERSITVAAYMHYNFVLQIGQGAANIIDLVMDAFGYEEEEIFIGANAKFFEENGTIKCPDAEVREKGIVNGKEYEAVDRELLIQRRDEGADLTCVCTSLVTDMSEMFRDMNFDQPIFNWDVSNVINMSWMFSNNPTFNQPIGIWDVSKVINMRAMFAGSYVNNIGYLGTPVFDQSLSNWDVGNVSNMEGMFSNSTFNQPIGNWNVSNVTSMSGVFTLSEFNQPIGDWDVSKVTDMRWMFSGSKFNQSIDNWNVENVTDMQGLFFESIFNKPIDNWNVKNVRNMNAMFTYSEFNQPIGNWDVSNVFNMSSMFADSQFNQPIGDWDVSNVTSMGLMFLGSQFNQNISNWCVTNISSEPTNFSINSPLTPENKPIWGTCPD